jgi:hypothetical protein
METMFRLLLLLLLDLAMQEVVQNRPQHDDRPQLADLQGGSTRKIPTTFPIRLSRRTFTQSSRDRSRFDKNCQAVDSECHLPWKESFIMASHRP